MNKIKEKIWDKLFLDFYLDKRFSWRFKLVNWLTEDWIRTELCSIIHEAELCKTTLDHIQNVPDSVKRRLDKIADSADYLLRI